MSSRVTGISSHRERIMIMRFARRLLIAAFWLSTSVLSFAAQGGLSVVQAGPEGEIAKIEEANEIHVQFSESMVALGRIPDPVKAPFIKISPSINGTFRWAGTRLLIFTPADGISLPYNTTYKITVDAAATSLDGRSLDKPYVFSFTTPTVRLLKAEWYRKTKRFDSPAVLAFRFNQKVTPQAVSLHLKLQYNAYEWKPPEIQQNVMQRLANESPDAYVDFQKKVAQTTIATQSTSPVSYKIAKEWDKEKFPAGGDLVVVETSTPPPPQSQILATFDTKLPGLEGNSTPGTEQTHVFNMEPAFFINGLYCAKDCSTEFYNAIVFNDAPAQKDLLSKLSVVDITDPQHEMPLSTAKQSLTDKEIEEHEEWNEEGERNVTMNISLDLLGFPIKPARKYFFKVDKTLTSIDGQTLGYTWCGQVEYWHKSAFTSFGTGHGVWEKSGGPQLPFYSRNLTSIKQWAAPITAEDLVTTILKIDSLEFKTDGKLEHAENQNKLPPVQPTIRRLKPDPDVIQSFGLNLSKILPPAGTGLVWAGLQGEKPIPVSDRPEQEPDTTLVQVTNLGISVKDSPQNTLILITRLDDGMPVDGAEVTILTLDNKVFWKGTTDKNGVAMAQNTDMRLRLKLDRWEIPYTLAFVVTARKGEDFAYLCSDWNEGIRSWDFDVPVDLDEAKPVLRGTVFADRGVYKLGEEVHFKAILRQDTVTGIQLFAPGAKATIIVTDAEGKEINKRTLSLSEWGTADWTCKLPEDGSLGNYSIEATVADIQGSSYGSFIVAAYRKPDFRVDANLGGPDDLAGASIRGVITARYLFGAPMSGRSIKLAYYKKILDDIPTAVRNRFPAEKYAFLKEAWETGPKTEQIDILSKDAVLNADGTFSIDLATDIKAGYPYAYTLEGTVTDVSRQTIAGSASMPIHPAPWYLGFKRPDFFVDSKNGLHTEVVAVTPRGEVASGIKVTAILSQVQWNSVRQSEGEGFYDWESQRVEKEKWRGDVTTATTPVPLEVPLPEGGYFMLSITASDPDGRQTTSNTDFYVLGEGYTAWARFDHPRIDLVPEKKTYQPGETARIMIKSPWEKATAVLTTEREGIRTHREFALSSTQQTVEVPITEAEIPNLFVSVLLIKGRSSTTIEKDGSDPGKPAFKLGYIQLKVENGRKRLSVQVTPDKEEYRPAETATVSVQVKDCDGKPARSEVTLWAVDYGVLSLTGYKTPDVLDSVYVAKALQVMNSDSRQCIISRRVITPKGAEEGGGGGYEEGAENKVRKDFRVLAFWLGSAATDADGKLTTKQKLPESLTTFRIMAVINDKSHRFGWGEKEIRLSKPVLMTPAFPRFLALDDKAYFGAVVHSLLKDKGTAMVTMKSLDPSILRVTDSGIQSVNMEAQGTSEVRFHVEAKSVGMARLLMSAKLRGEEDSFELALPVRLLSSPEVVAAYGTAAPDAKETVTLPPGVVRNLGGLHVELASTAMVGLGEGARYLVEYPYGCAEQKASCSLALLLTAELGNACQLPDIKPDDLKKITEKTLKELEGFQCDNGGFAYWKGCCSCSSAYLTSYILHVFQQARKLGYKVSDDVFNQATNYLESQLGLSAGSDASQMPSYAAWQAFAAKVLAEAGKNVDSHITRIYGYKDRMPVFGLCFLWDAMTAAGEKGARPKEIRRRVQNAILPEGGTSHVEELADPYLLWYWNSSVRSTAIALDSLLRNTTPDPASIQAIVRWLMQARKKGRWDNTQENAWAMEALVDYYKKFETDVPDFTAVAAVGIQTLMTETFKGRHTESKIAETPMDKLLAMGKVGEAIPLTFSRQGTGTLFYTTRLKYASSVLSLNPLDSGISIERRYEPLSGGQATKTFKAGDLVEVVLTINLTKERKYLAVTDPIPAGFEPVEAWFATTSADLARAQVNEESGGTWGEWWQKGGFDHVERHDDHVLLFATRLSEGIHTFRYVCRATTVGTFTTAPTHGEEMYEPEVFGRTATDVIEVNR